MAEHHNLITLVSQLNNVYQGIHAFGLSHAQIVETVLELCKNASAAEKREVVQVLNTALVTLNPDARPVAPARGHMHQMSNESIDGTRYPKAFGLASRNESGYAQPTTPSPATRFSSNRFGVAGPQNTASSLANPNLSVAQASPTADRFQTPVAQRFGDPNSVTPRKRPLDEPSTPSRGGAAGSPSTPRGLMKEFSARLSNDIAGKDKDKDGSPAKRPKR